VGALCTHGASYSNEREREPKKEQEKVPAKVREGNRRISLRWSGTFGKKKVVKSER